MFIKSAHQICIQTSNEPGRILIGVGSPSPAYVHVQIEITEKEARDFAAALVKVADECAQVVADNERMNSAIAELAGEFA